MSEDVVLALALLAAIWIGWPLHLIAVHLRQLVKPTTLTEACMRTIAREEGDAAALRQQDAIAQAAQDLWEAARQLRGAKTPAGDA